MKRIFLLPVFLLCFALGINAQVEIQATQDAPAVTTAEQKDGPQMDFVVKNLDYGTIEQGSDGVRYFEFTNTGNAPLIVTHAKGSCGCTVPDWTHLKAPLPPGESAKMAVRYDTNRVGPFKKSVTLTTNIEGDPIKLTIEGKVEKKPEEPAGVPAGNSGLFGGGDGGQ